MSVFLYNLNPHSNHRSQATKAMHQDEEDANDSGAESVQSYESWYGIEPSDECRAQINSKDAPKYIR